MAGRIVASIVPHPAWKDRIRRQPDIFSFTEHYQAHHHPPKTCQPTAVFWTILFCLRLLPDNRQRKQLRPARQDVCVGHDPSSTLLLASPHGGTSSPDTHIIKTAFYIFSIPTRAFHRISRKIFRSRCLKTTLPLSWSNVLRNILRVSLV